MINTTNTTTEDLMATCQNFPHTEDAYLAAQELQRRIGTNRYSNGVYRTRAQALATLAERLQEASE